MVKTPSKKTPRKKRVSVPPAITEDRITPELNSLRYALHDCQRSNEDLRSAIENLIDHVVDLSEAVGDLETTVEKKAEEKNTK